jgi:hypothetical protein
VNLVKNIVNIFRLSEHFHNDLAVKLKVGFLVIKRVYNG